MYHLFFSSRFTFHSKSIVTVSIWRKRIKVKQKPITIHWKSKATEIGVSIHEFNSSWHDFVVGNSILMINFAGFAFAFQFGMAFSLILFFYSVSNGNQQFQVKKKMMWSKYCVNFHFKRFVYMPIWDEIDLHCIAVNEMSFFSHSHVWIWRSWCFACILAQHIYFCIDRL